MSMISMIGALALLQTQAPIEPKVVTASLFKNGYAMVMREVPVNGETTFVTQIPMVSLGTFWVSGSEGVSIQEVATTMLEKKSMRPIGNFSEMFRINAGKQVEVTTINLGQQKGTIVGVQGDMLVLRSDTVRMFPLGEVRYINFPNDPQLNVEETNMSRALRLKSKGKGKVFLLGLERGITWAPSYGIELEEGKKLRMVAKATILNDLAKFDGIDLRFVTGFPNVPWATLQEPLLSGQSVDQFTNFLNSVGINGPSGGGGRFAGRREVTSNIAGQMAADFDAGFEATGSPEQMAEDLFFYKQPNMTMKPGDRSMVMLFDMKGEYEQIFVSALPSSVSPTGERFDSGAPAVNDVWNTIRFTNSSKMPFTTAPVTVFKNQQVLGQDTLTYTSAGAKATIKMSKALDIRVDSEEEELTREARSLTTPNGVVFDLVTLRGTVVVKNRKAEAAKLTITKQCSGEITKSDGDAKITKLARGLREMNPTSELKWEPTVESGKETTFTYTYKLYLRSY